MEGVLKGKAAIVTGGSLGIGKGEALALAKARADVVICARNIERLEAAAKEICNSGGNCIPVPCDITNAEDIKNVVAETIARFGRIDILVNNAQGALVPECLENVTDDYAMSAYQSGPLACLRFMRECFPYMKEQRYGRIINTSSGAITGAVPRMGAYAMAKGAIASLTYVAAKEWSKFGITANVLFPYIGTEAYYQNAVEEIRAAEAKLPVGYLGKPEEDLGPVLVFIASEASHYLTAQPFYVDAGLHISRS